MRGLARRGQRPVNVNPPRLQSWYTLVSSRGAAFASNSVTLPEPLASRKHIERLRMQPPVA